MALGPKVTGDSPGDSSGTFACRCSRRRCPSRRHAPGSAERGDGVDDEQRPGVVGEPASLRAAATRRSTSRRVRSPALGLTAAAKRGGDVGRFDDLPHGARPAPGWRRSVRRCPHPRAEHAVDAHHRFVAGLEQVDHAASMPHCRARHRDRQLVARLEDELQQAPRLVHDAQVLGIEVPISGCSWRAARAVDVAGPGPSRTERAL